jgi:hypothetical protein
MLVRLVYASRAAAPIQEGVVDSILAQSRKNNPQEGITGVLCICQSGVFMQVLEGGRDAVNRLYARVIADPRHQDVTLLAYGEITARRFAGWRMGRVDLSKVNTGIVLKYSEMPRLDPFAICGGVALTLLEELMDSAAIVGGS